MKRITRERLRRGLTQRKVAERTGVGYNTYFKVEQGVHVPTVTSPTGIRLSRFFGYRLKTLLTEV